MKLLLVFSIFFQGILLSLVVPRTYKRNTGISLLFATDLLLLLAVYHNLEYFYFVLAYLDILFLFTFILYLYQVNKGFFQYLSFGLLAVSSVFISAFMLPDIYYAMPLSLAVMVIIFSLLNLAFIYRMGAASLPADKMLLAALSIKSPALGIFLLGPLFFPVLSEDFVYLQVVSSIFLSAASFGVLFRAKFFKIKVRPSPDIMWKSLLLLGLLSYGVFLVYLDRYASLSSVFFYAKIFVILSFAVVVCFLVFDRRVRHSIKFFVLTNIYASRYDSFEILKKIFALLQENGEDLERFVKSVLEYLIRRHPVTGISFSFDAPERSVSYRIGRIDYTRSLLRFDNSSTGTRVSVEFFRKDTFDEDDRANLRMISELVFRLALDIYLTREKIISEKLETAERLRLFLLHDVKNICHTLVMLNENISKVHPDKAEEFLSDLRESVPHMVGRANKALNTITMLRETVSASCFSIKDVVNDIVSGIVDRDIYRLTLRDGMIFADRDRVSIAVENILRNALDKSLKEGGVRVRIEGGANGNGNYELLISDNGSPIDDSVITLIFEPFFTTKSGGIGIGLYQAREFIKSQGGEITVDSSLSGVCFKLQLPIARDA